MASLGASDALLGTLISIFAADISGFMAPITLVVLPRIPPIDCTDWTTEFNFKPSLAAFAGLLEIDLAILLPSGTSAAA